MRRTASRRTRIGFVAAAVAVTAALLLPAGVATALTGQPHLAAPQPAVECLPGGGVEGTINAKTYQKPLGTVRALMLFLDFPDVHATTTPAEAAHQFDGAADWLRTSSYGKLDLQITTVNRWFRMPARSMSYHIDRDMTSDDHAAYIEDAVAVADASVDFSGYDLYYFVATPNATAIVDSPTFIGGPDSPIHADGITIRLAVTFGSDAPGWGFKVLDHETGHTFGLPDYYAFTGDDQFVYTGGWDLMGDISGHAPDEFAWDKWRFGWLSAAQVGCYDIATTTDVELSALETPGGVKAMFLRTGTQQITVAEYRTTNGNDAGACDTGVLIYKVNNALDTGAGPIRVVDAHRNADLPAGCQDGLDDAAYGPADAAYTDTTNGITIEVTSVGATAQLHIVRSRTWTPPDVANRRTLTLRASGTSTVTFTGRLTSSPSYVACVAGRSVELQEWVNGAWRVIRRANTTSSGTWSYAFRAPKARYRLVAPSIPIGSRPRHLCGTAASAIVTRT